MVTVCVCGAGKDSTEVAAIKKALPGAEVLVQGEDAAVFFLLADHLRGCASTCRTSMRGLSPTCSGQG